MPAEDLPISNKLWLSVSQAAKLFGVEQKTIRRAIKAKEIIYIVEGDRYSIEMGSLLRWAYQSTRLKHKLEQDGVGKFVQEWKGEFVDAKTLKRENTRTLKHQNPAGPRQSGTYGASIKTPEHSPREIKKSKIF